jgi:hypothetical protein
MWRSLARGYTALEFGFAAQAFEIAPNDRHRELPVASSVGDLAVARFQRVVDLDLVESFGVADIGEAEVEPLPPGSPLAGC